MGPCDSYYPSVASPFRRRRIVPPVVHNTDEFEYEMVALRQMEQDAMVWQTPTLAFTAQAFLLTIALAATSAPGGRVVAAALGIVVASLSMRLMRKHRLLAQIDTDRMVELEGRMGMGPVAERGWAPRQGKPVFHAWIWGLRLFIAADLASIVFTAVGLFTRVRL